MLKIQSKDFFVVRKKLGSLWYQPSESTADKIVVIHLRTDDQLKYRADVERMTFSESSHISRI